MTLTRATPSTRRQYGSAVMIVLLIMITGSAAFLLTQLNKGDPQQPRNIDTRRDLNAIRQALVGYAQMNGSCLPCPGTSTNGQAPSKPCLSAVGFVPWETLSLGDSDRWGHRYRYVVDLQYTNACIAPGPPPTPPASLSVITRNNAGAQVTVASDLVAVIITHGVNGYGARTATGVALPNPPASNIDEQANVVGTVSFSERAASVDTAAAGGPFDDLVGYIPRQSLADEYGMTP